MKDKSLIVLINLKNFFCKMETQTLISELLKYNMFIGMVILGIGNISEPFYSINNIGIDIDYVKSKGCN